MRCALSGAADVARRTNAATGVGDAKKGLELLGVRGVTRSTLDLPAEESQARRLDGCSGTEGRIS